MLSIEVYTYWVLLGACSIELDDIGMVDSRQLLDLLKQWQMVLTELYHGLDSFYKVWPDTKTKHTTGVERANQNQ